MSRLAEMDEYDSMFGRRLADEDFLAAGFTPQEVQQYRGAIVQPSLTPQDISAMEAQYGTLQAPDPTLRQRGAARVQDALINRGLDPYVAGSYSRRILGDTAPTDGGLGIGLADFTPLGAVFGVQEGGRTAVQGYQQGDPLQMGFGALEAGLNIVGAAPLSATIGRGIAETASRMDPNTLYSVFGPPVGTRSPLRAPETGGGAGRPPLTFDEVDRAMQEAPLAETPRITPRDLEGARIIPTVADLTRAGGYYTGIDASRIDVPEPLMGGPGYPLLPSSQQAGLVWAVQGQHIGTRKAGSGADLIAVTAMNPTSHQSNISFINSLIKTTGAYVRDGRIPSTVLDDVDATIRSAGVGGDQNLSGLERFPGFRSPNLDEWIRNATFEERSRIADIIANKETQALGMPNVSRILQETVDPRYAGANPRDTLLFIEPDFSAPPVDLAAEGLPVHPSYRYGIRGRVFGALDQNISTFEMFPDFWGERNVNAFGPGFNKGGRRAFDLSLPIQEVTGRQVEDLERILTMEAARGTNLSPIDTRIVVNSLTDRWRPTTSPVTQGGASPQAFVDAIQNSKYRPALTNYTPQEIKAGARSGDLVAYQLGEDDIFFALDAKPDYSWAGVDMLPDDKALVGVVSNAPGSRGTAAPSVIAKALEEGTTILDAFAVPSQRFPNGFLPEYYGEFGFEEVGRVPFDRDMYVADHGEQAYEDLLEAWRSDGWDESMGMPPVIVMRWSGSDADRAATAAGIRGAGAPSHRAGTEGLVAEAEGLAGQLSDQTLPQGAPSVGPGDTGAAGTGEGLRLSGRARRGAEGVLGLTPEQLRNRGIPEEQIQELMRRRDVGQ